MTNELSHDSNYRNLPGRIPEVYPACPKGATASHLLSWSHWVELLKIEDPLERTMQEAAEGGKAL